MNKRLILYVHGQGGCAEEASVYEPLFPDCAVKGMVYISARIYKVLLYNRKRQLEMARHAPESVSAYIFKRTCAGRQQRGCNYERAV